MATFEVMNRVVRPLRSEGRQTGSDDRDTASTPDALSWILSGFLVLSTSGTLALFDSRLIHWFLIPVTICGVLITVDAVEWLRRRTDIFDPKSMLGLLGVHFFYTAPILNVMLDAWPRYLATSSDWRRALGIMALLNVVGLGIYRLFLDSRPGARRHLLRHRRELAERRFIRIGMLATGIGVLAFLLEFVMFGGLSGFISVMTGDRSALAGMGWLLIAAETFPLMAFMVAVVRWRDRLAQRKSYALLLLLALAIAQFFVGGLRGSRTNTMWPVLLGLILVHLMLFRISRKSLVVCLLVFGVFTYLYGLYKSAGLEVLDIARGTRTIEQISTETGRDLPTLLLQDIGRADIQALVLERQSQGYGELGYGVTYVGGASVLVPRVLLPERPSDKVSIGTDLTVGAGAYDSGLRSAVVYGMAGEATLNFGPAGAVASFVLLGWLIRLFRRQYVRASSGSALAPKLIAPMVCLTAVIAPSGDFDNHLWYLLKFVLPYVAVVLLASSTWPTWTMGRSRRPVAGRHRPGR
ncbi:hypothetical protein GCM10027290_14800 [Micromonospora sonneratiae]|uniref:O-antigen polysaccharide polymerase Wzy n=1 Tax=Micromonospora sonneratiae TaxID=1184706 RepID=A0ABW3YEG2_9ACTN